MDVTDEDGVRTVTFDRPEALNAMTHEVAADLADAVEGADPATHDAVVVTGEGRAFSAGGDVEAMAERDEDPDESIRRLEASFGRVVEATLGGRVPVVARVDGDAVGAGLAVTAVSDFAFAAASARFSCAFVRVGLVPDTGGTFLLPKLVGLRAAKRLALTGEFVDGAEAADIGLVNRAVPEDELDAAVDGLLDRLRAVPTRTVGLTKRALHENLSRHWREALDHEHHVQALAYESPEHEEGVAAFIEDRDPEWD